MLKRDNLDYFVKHGMCEDCTNVDYYFVINGETSFQFPEHENVQVFWRKNECGDFGALDHVFTLVDYKKYKRVMVINDTVRGPFVDHHYRFLMGEDFHFTDIFASYLTDEVKLVGSYINCGSVWGGCGGVSFSHVQTMAWYTDDIGMEIIRPRLRCYEDKIETVVEGEIGISRAIIDKGYNIASLQYAYLGVNFRDDEKYRTRCNDCNDATYPSNYYGQSVTPTEVVFFKNTRVPDLPLINQYTQWFPMD